MIVRICLWNAEKRRESRIKNFWVFYKINYCIFFLDKSNLDLRIA